MNAQVLEIVRFRLAPGVSPEQARALAEPLTRWLQEQPGFLWRTLAEPAEGQQAWTDVVGWTDLQRAHAAAAALLEQPEIRSAMALLDQSSVELVHAPVFHATR
jgi:hypothetical protein